MITATDEITEKKWSLHSHADMSPLEAKEITIAIQQNFDSLGLMLKSANERKAWKALGYRDFGSYCNNEFGKSKSRAYQIIEEAEIAEALREEGGPEFKIPAQSYLRLLKNLPTHEQIEAIKYAEDLATTENKKPTKMQMQLAVEKISGKPEQFKHTLNELGFTKGAEIVTVRGVDTGNRGFIRKLDKKGQLWVELHTRNSSLIPYDVASLRVLQVSEKPAKAAYPGTTEIGDKVLIFSRGLENTIGEIAVRINEKMAGVRLESSKLIELPYAELEVIEVETEEAPDLLPDSLSDEQLIILLQTQLITCGERKPKLAEKIIGEIWKMLATETKEKICEKLIQGWEARLKAYQKANDDLFLANNELRESLLDCHRQAAKLQTRLDEAEQVISQFVTLTTIDSTSPEFSVENAPEISSPGDAAAHTEFSVENAAEIPTPGDTAANTELLVENTPPSLWEPQTWLKVLDSNNFTQGYVQLEQLNEEPTESYRGWDIYTYDSSSMAHISHPIKGVFSIDFLWAFEKEIIKPLEWLKSIINQVEDFCPGQLSLFLTTGEVTSKVRDTEIEQELSPEILERLEIERNKTTERIRSNLSTKYHATNQKIPKQLAKSTAEQNAKLKNLEKFSQFRVGQTICHARKVLILGKIIKLEFSQGEMPIVWVRYFKDGELDKTPTHEIAEMIFRVDML